MPLLFRPLYETRSGDNIGDPQWHNIRWKSVDVRLGDLEARAETVDSVVAGVQALALGRIDDVLAPEFLRLRAITDVGVMFRASSTTEMIVEIGPKALSVSTDDRGRFAAQLRDGLQPG